MKFLWFFVLIIIEVNSDQIYEFTNLKDYYSQILNSYSGSKYPPILYEPYPFDYLLINYKNYLLKESKQDIITKCKDDNSRPCNQIAEVERSKEAKILISKTRDRKYCIESEELAYLDFLAWLEENKNPYAHCKNDRIEEDIEKNLSKLRKEIFTLLLPVRLTTELHLTLLEFPDFPEKKEWENRIHSIENQRKELLINMSNFQVYASLYPKLERKEYSHPTLDQEFVLINDLLVFVYKYNQDLYFNREFLLIDQMKWNTIPKETYQINNKAVKTDISNNSKILINYPLKTEHKNLVTNLNGCISILYQKEPRINLGFYSGFFHKYSYQYEGDESKNKEDEIYKKISNKLRLNYFKYTIQSELFEQRLLFLAKNCSDLVKKLNK
jgi:hypothetical protein